tara:strand:+ start:929 stop:1639 length:711 start_codon:yes stop_codon:yes gene_type:complete
MKIKKKQLKSYHNLGNDIVKEAIEKDFPNLIEKFEKGWYHAECGDKTIIYLTYFDDFKQDSRGLVSAVCYFIHGNYMKGGAFTKIKSKSSDEEVSLALSKEAIRLGFIQGASANNTVFHDKKKNNFNIDSDAFIFNSEDNYLAIGKEDSFYKIFQDGVWATVLEEIYRTGDRFTNSKSEEFMLAQYDNSMCCLILMNGSDKGNRLWNGQKVKNHLSITKAELNKISGGENLKRQSE